MKTIIIAGTNSGVGKTTITIGLIALLKKRGLKVQPFKAGPDFIDTGYHTMIAGRPSRNLDAWMMSEDYVKESFYKKSSAADFAVIFNNVGSENHYRILKEAVEHRCKTEVLGYLPREKNIEMPSRHLGLVTTEDNPHAEKLIDKLTGIMETSIDIDKILDISSIKSKLSIFNIFPKKEEENKKKIILAVAYDKAFNFYYQDNLDILTECGAELIFFSPLNDKNIPADINGIYIGGGYPEIYAKELEANHSIRKQIKEMAEEGLFIYAECG